MIKQPISVVFDLDAKIGNSKLIAISHVEDKYNEVLEVNVRQNGAHIDLTGVTAIARMVLHAEKDYLISDNVPCTINNSGNILIPFDNAVVKIMQGTVKIEVSISRGEDDVLTLQFPLWVSVKGSILDGAEVTPKSEGTIPDLLKDAKAALENLGDYDNLESKPQIDGVTLRGDQTADELGLQKKLTAGKYISINPDNGVIEGFEITGWKISSAIDNCIEDGVLYSTWINGQGAYVLARNITTNITQYAFCFDGHMIWRTRQAETSWQPAGEWSAWENIGDSEIASGVINQNGTISFYDADGNLLFTTTGASVIGPKGDNGDTGAAGADGYSPTVSTTNLDAQTLVTVTDNNGAHNFYVKDGSSVTNAAVDENGDLIISIQQKPTSSVHPTIHTLEVNAGHVVGAAGAKGDKGDKGDTGNDYVLTPQDKTDIADIVLQLLPTTQGVQYGN